MQNAPANLKFTTKTCHLLTSRSIFVKCSTVLLFKFHSASKMNNFRIFNCSRENTSIRLSCVLTLLKHSFRIIIFLTIKSLGQYRNIHTFLSFLGSLLKQYILFEIFLLFSLPPRYTKLKLGKNSGYTRPTLLGRGWTCVNCKTLQKRKCPKTFSMIVWKRGGKRKGNFIDSLKIFIKKILQN